ncbi:MAG: hypothetical protein ACRCT7_14985 [Shewanella sp.]
MPSKPNAPLLPKKLMPEQGIIWSQQRILGLVCQIAVLLFCIVVLANVIIELGQKTILKERASQRYSELQSVANDLTDQINFQHFQTRSLAKSTLLKSFLQNPQPEFRQQLVSSWQELQANLDSLQGIAVYDGKGQQLINFSDELGAATLSDKLLTKISALEHDQVYLSPITFSSGNGKIKPVVYQVTKINYPEFNSPIYLITFHAMDVNLARLQNSFGDPNASLFLFNVDGQLNTLSSNQQTSSRIPTELGTNLNDSYPALWKNMEKEHYGQFQGENVTLVFLKFQLKNGQFNDYSYFLLSYIDNAYLYNQFAMSRYLVLILLVCLGLLAMAFIGLKHSRHLQKRAGFFSMQLAEHLFDDGQGRIISTDQGRIITANAQAATTLLMLEEDLKDRSLQRCLQLQDKEFSAMLTTLNQYNIWKGELDLRQQQGDYLAITIRKVPFGRRRDYYLLLTITQQTDLCLSREQVSRLTMFSDGAIAGALFAPDGQLIEVNPAFSHQLKQEMDDINLISLVNHEQAGLWTRVQEQLTSLGHWHGNLVITLFSQSAQEWQLMLTSHTDSAGEVLAITSYWLPACPKHTLENPQDIASAKHNDDLLGDQHELQRCFEKLDKSSKHPASLLLIDISPEIAHHHISALNQRDTHQHSIEMHLIEFITPNFKLCRGQTGQLLLLMPETLPNQAHLYASDLMNYLIKFDLADGLNIGIAAGTQQDNLATLISHADIALHRAKQTGEQQICQAYTRPLSAL